jgi:peptidoglycan pentaglycine glycine transferase (the first glycine)
MLRIETSARPSDAEWDRFLESVPDGNHQQSSLWSKAKSFSRWQVLRLIVRDRDTIVGGAQILHRSVPVLNRLGYVPRGPVFANEDPAVYEFMFRALDSAARSEGIGYLAVQPARVSAPFVIDLIAHGFRPSPFTLAPTATVLIDLSKPRESQLCEMRSGTRRGIRTALASDLVVRVGTGRDVPAFHGLLQSSARRHRFSPPPESYFRRIWQVFSPSDDIVLFLAELKGEPVAGELDIAFGDTLVSKRAGWSGQYGRLHPNELLVWTALNWAKERGLKHFDMEGLDPDLAHAILGGRPIPEGAGAPKGSVEADWCAMDAEIRADDR